MGLNEIFLNPYQQLRPSVVRCLQIVQKKGDVRHLFTFCPNPGRSKISSTLHLTFCQHHCGSFNRSACCLLMSAISLFIWSIRSRFFCPLSSLTVSSTFSWVSVPSQPEKIRKARRTNVRGQVLKVFFIHAMVFFLVKCLKCFASL